MNHCEDERIVFIARIWLEPGSEERQWRGHIQRVQGEQETYFHDFNGMISFLETTTGVSFPAHQPSDESKELGG